MKAQDQMKSLAKRVQKEAKVLGYDIKLNHALEIVSRSHFNQSWHVVSKRDDIKSIEELDTLVVKAYESHDVETCQTDCCIFCYMDRNTEDARMKEYFSLLKAQKNKNKIIYGYVKGQGFIIEDSFKNPGAFYGGGLGSGKSCSLRFTLASHMATNSKTTSYFLVDTKNSLSELKILLNEPREAVKAITTIEKFRKLIDELYDEMKKRVDLFNELNIFNLEKYNERQENLSQIVVAIEGISYLYDEIDFHKEDNIPGTTTNKMVKLLRAGRSYGIFFQVTNFEANSEKLPSMFMVGLLTKMLFKPRNKMDAMHLNLMQAMEIQLGEQGKCAYEDGFMQFPYFDDKFIDMLLAKEFEKFDAHFLSLDLKQY